VHMYNFKIIIHHLS